MNELGATASAAVSVPNTHYVKQLTASYLRNAGLSLTGPTAMEEAQRGKYNRFKLADDVVISKVYREENTNGDFSAPRKGSGNGGGQGFEPNEQVLEQLSKIALMRSYQEQMMQQQAEKEGRERSRERLVGPRSRQHSGQGERSASGHLSGEQIRKLRESQKAAERARVEEERRVREGSSKGEASLVGRKSTFKSPGTSSTTTPIMSSSDRSWSDLEETTLEGEKISCFAVGGEYRLCLPQILNSVLEKVSLQDINQACDQLQIFCSTCSAEQLQVLKDATVLPVTAHQCGLITKSDAERLCSHLLDKSPPRASVFDPKSSPFSFKVQHECFGRCEGLVLPEAYTSPTARCVECLQCEGLFSPQKFVCHSHSPENRTCHWGFDSSNWLTYLQLSEDYTKEERERHSKVMEDFKNRYCPALRTPQQQGAPVREGKRRQDDADQYEKMPAPTKRAKLESGSGDPYAAYMKALNQAKAKASLNWPWPAKPGVPSFPGLPPHSYPGPPPPPHTEFRRPEEVREGVVSRDERYGESPQPKQAKYTINPIEKVEPVEPVERFSQPALAEEISTVAEALAGAPKHATETVLKILERLTQRLDKAERDRDLAFGKYKELQTRYAQLEEELAKKRGELRELLRQDCRPPSPRPIIDTEQKSRTNGAPSVDDQSRGSSAEERGERVGGQAGQGANLTVIVARLGEAGRLGGGEASRCEASEESSSKLEEALPNSLPKLEVKSPRHLLEDAPVSPPRLPPTSSANSIEVAGEGNEVAVREEMITKFHKHLPHKSKDPEEALQHRMVKMEAELTALREALSTRTTGDKKQEQPANGSEDAAANLQVQGVQGIQQVQGLNGGNNGDVGGAQRLQIAE